jgi:penicillin G amidase
MPARVYVDEKVSVERDDLGVIHIRSDDEPSLYRGLGFAHGVDRALQLLFMRILGQGRAAEILDASLVEVDRFFRKMNWRGELDRESAKLGHEAKIISAAYVEGINLALARSVPWELRLVGYRPEAWTIEDTILTARMIGFLGLAQGQGEIERLIVQMVQGGVDDARLENLFPGVLGGLDRKLIEKVRLGDRVVPKEVLFVAGGARMMASNNWAVSGSRTSSGRPIFANDPHLEVNRLPAVWYEVVFETRARWGMAATMPGLPGLLLGRTNDLAWGATYTFADAIDSWIEEVKDGKVRRGDGWVSLDRRTEIIEKKSGGSEEVTFWETDEHGVLDGDPNEPGFVLSTRWSANRAGARSIEASLGMWKARSVEEGMKLLGQLELSFNWVFADAAGRIGYQMSGLIPIRRDGWTGLVPVPGWDSRNDWRGFHSMEELPRVIDPERGYIVTANDDQNRLGKIAPINVDMGPYRADRISEMLEAKDKLSSADMKRIQLDLRSKQAERFMSIMKPLLPDNPDGRALAEWNFEYGSDSLGADAFERFYAELFRTVFGFVDRGSTVMADFYWSFDRVLLSEKSPWFDGATREEIYRRAIENALTSTPRPWGERRTIVQRHLLFGEKFPRWFGFDRGPVPLPGGRATPNQGQIYKMGDRLTTFAASFRLIADFAERGWESCLAGGPSDRRFSRWYASDMPNWISGRYKCVKPFSDT